jgi:hypothetical protein
MGEVVICDRLKCCNIFSLQAIVSWLYCRWIEIMRKRFFAPILWITTVIAACSVKPPKSENNFDADTLQQVVVVPPQQTSQISIPLLPSVCPSDMVEVIGNFCPLVVQNCLNLDMSVHNVNGYVRCLEFSKTLLLWLLGTI